MFGLRTSLLPPASVGRPRFPEYFRISRSVSDHPNGTRLHYTDVSDPRRPAKGSAVLLPGVYGTEVSEEVVAGVFVDLGYRIRLPMLRGYGISPERSVRGAASLFGNGIEGMIVEDLPFMIARANEDFSEPVTLLGFSGGALLAANYLSGMVADTSAGRTRLFRDEGTARERAERVSGFIDFAGPHGSLPLFLPHKFMLKAMTPFLKVLPAYDLRSDAFVQSARDHLLACHLAMTPWPMRVTPMLFTPMAGALSVFMNPANLTYEEFLRFMYVGFGRAEHDHMVEQKRHLLGEGFPNDSGYDFLGSSAGIYVPTTYVNGAFDRMSSPDQVERVLATMPPGMAKGRIVIPGRGHLDSSFGDSSYRPLREALSAALGDK